MQEDVKYKRKGCELVGEAAMKITGRLNVLLSRSAPQVDEGGKDRQKEWRKADRAAFGDMVGHLSLQQEGM